MISPLVTAHRREIMIDRFLIETIDILPFNKDKTTILRLAGQ